MATMTKVYPCPKCQSRTLIIKDGIRVECSMCWSTATIAVWNKAYMDGVRETAELRKKLRKEGRLAWKGK